MVDSYVPVLAPPVDLIDPVTDRRWADLARSDGSLFSSPPWLNALSSAYGFEVEALITHDRDGNPTGGLPFIRLGSGQWRRMCSLPFSDYCDPIDRDGSSWPVISDLLASSQLPVQLRCLGESSPTEDPSFAASDPPDLWHAMTLVADEEVAWSKLSGSARRAVRKARNSGIEVKATNDRGDLRAFYELHLGTRKNKYRLLAQPFSFFTSLADSFGDDFVLLGAWHDQSLIAGILLLGWTDTLYYKFNASTPEALELRPNDLLMWEASRLGVTRGLWFLDLGRTDSDHESLARYKSKYADREDRIYTIYRGQYRRDPVVSETLGPLTELITRPEVPNHVAEEAGKVVYHHFA